MANASQLSRRKCGWSALAILFVFLNLLSIEARAEVKVSVKLSQNPVPANQVVNLVISIENGDLQVLPEPALPPPVGLAGAPNQAHQMSFVNGVQSSTTQIIWPISCAKPGVYTIPSFNVQVSGKAYATTELKVEFTDGGNVAKPDATGKTALDPILQLQVGKSEFYQGEIIPVTATLYVPLNVNLRRAGLIEVTKSDFAVQRFPQSAEQGLETLGSVRYRTFNFASTLSALKAGKAVLGPTKMELVVDVMQQGGFGFFGGAFQSKKVTVEAAEIPVNVLALPSEGKPAGFNGAVGDFTLKATSASHDVMVGEPVTVDLEVRGQGNFDALEAPQLMAKDGWKQYPPRRYNVDNTDPNTADLMNRGLGFSQILVPEKVLPAVPPFEFSFFNPRTKAYSTLRSNAIELNVKPNPKAAPTMMTEVEGAGSRTAAKKAELLPPPVPDITDIVARLPAVPVWAVAMPPLAQNQNLWLVNGVLGFGFVVLVAAHLMKRRKLAQALTDDVDRRAMLKDVESSGLSEAEFYRRVAQFLHLYSGGVMPEAAKKLLERYETLNFAGPGAGSKPVDPAARAEAIAILKQIKPSGRLTKPVNPGIAAALVLIMSAGGVLGADTTGNDRYQTAAQALAKDDFKTAQKVGQALVKEGYVGPELFTLLGHAAYKLKNPGEAAIWYQRARFFPSAIPEVGQNLRHIGDSLHYFKFEQNPVIQSIALFGSRTQWAVAASTGVWLIVFGTAFLILGVVPVGRVWIVAALVLGVALVSFGLIGVIERPTAASLQDLSYVTSVDALARTAAAEISGHVISVPPGSTVRRLETRGAWTYVEIPQQDENVFGWLKTNDLQPVWPFDAGKLP